MIIEVIGEDPGSKCGIARFTSVDGDVKDWEAFEVSADGAANWLAHMLPQYAGLGDRRVVVACERFIITPQTGRMGRTDRYDAIELIGVTRHLCRWWKHEFTLQSSSDAKSAVSNQNLKNAGWWTPRSDGHAIDATRHAVLGMMSIGIHPPWV